MNTFVEGWSISQTLGEGAYGEVKLLVNHVTGHAVAMKVIDCKKHREAQDLARKEAVVHSMVNNPNIIKFFGQRRDKDTIYIFLEYAAGGELFDKIEPDIGMPHWEAHKYFKQLLSGVEYLHSKGIAHRDLKPENLLLDIHDNLKISDFGLATFFRVKGKERTLDKRCGTLPYVAPEVLVRPYYAEPADLWSCGIILVAMLGGELPWDKPTVDCVEYLAWKDNQYTHLTPWTKIDTLALSLIRKILVPLPTQRYNVEKIKQHRWYCKRFIKTVGQVSSPLKEAYPSKRLCSGGQFSQCASVEDDRLCQSQPEMFLFNPDPISDFDLQSDGYAQLFSFSQPTSFEDLLVSSQLTQSTQSPQTNVQKLMRRMTRFFVEATSDEATLRLTAALDKLGYGWRSHAVGVVTVSTVDRRKTQLIFKANVLSMNGKTLLDFRLSKGCGIEFKRRFILIKQSLSDIVSKGPVTWPLAVATNSVP